MNMVLMYYISFRKIDLNLSYKLQNVVQIGKHPLPDLFYTEMNI